TSKTPNLNFTPLTVKFYYGLLTRNAADDATDDVAQATPRNYAARTSNLNSEVCL
ncbi:hypothetical protein HK096_000212, partial [Nowakowskiella sp. JEL0078]